MVAAIHGTVLLGGLEVILAGHYRVGVQTARFGLPGVTMGLLPGAGGTQRLPHVVGVEQALQMLVSGDMFGAGSASDGLLDVIVDGDLTAAAWPSPNRSCNEQRPLRKTREREDKIGAARGKPEPLANFRQSVARQTRGFTAPEYCIKAVEAAVHLPFAQGLVRERELFLELLHLLPESNAQRYFFVAERQVAQSLDVLADTTTRESRKAAVIRAGTMGGGIANSMLRQRDREAEQLLLEGALPQR